ncbi:nicotinate-nucleotide adenylyltransferase [Parvibaculum sp. MBR-TMA-1.3b-4.2]|jgi:nicotinate-nucleotide adenylyltransferase
MTSEITPPGAGDDRRNEMLTPGLRVGLLGGSFNPAHEAHLLVSRMAMRALGLDRVWWLVSPGNPLKPEKGMAPLAERLASARTMARDPRICVTDIERRLETRYTVDTIASLVTLHPDVHFVWLMGADNMIQLPRWYRWKELTRMIPIAIYPRPGYTLKARLSPAAQALRQATLDTGDARRLATAQPPALCFLEGPVSSLSATQIRESEGWPITARERDASRETAE